MQEDRAGEAEASVALAVPEQESGNAKQHRERRGQPEVQLLTGVEAALRHMPPTQPGTIVRVERVELMKRSAQALTIARDSQQAERDQPGDCSVNVDRLDEWPAADKLGKARQVERETRAKQDEKRCGVNPVGRA